MPYSNRLMACKRGNSGFNDTEPVPGALTPEERELIERHPEIGYKKGPVLEAIRHHHEKLDGSGYPGRMKGDEISMVARIMTVADFCNALNTDGPTARQCPEKRH